MAEYRHLTNAPITEAVIDLQARLSTNFQVSSFLPLKQELYNHYPGFRQRRFISGGFGFERDRPIIKTAENSGVDGYIFTSEDNKCAVQFRKDGFTFSRLKPYTNWGNVYSEAMRLWGIYLDKAKPTAVTRVAVRFINLLQIPLPINDFTDYLTTPPGIPRETPQIVRSFFSKVVINDNEKGLDANIIQALEKGIGTDNANIILDIDAYKVKDFNINENFNLSFSQLRDLKNRIFSVVLPKKLRGCMYEHCMRCY
jgi:uncharacterized protein (TIGR04255 family)